MKIGPARMAGPEKAEAASNSKESKRQYRARLPAPQAPDQIRHQRLRFAREAVFEEFRHRDAKAIDQEGFEDRKPNQQPRPSPEAVRLVRVGHDWQGRGG